MFPERGKQRQGNVQVLDNTRLNSVVKKEDKDSSRIAVWFLHLPVTNLHFLQQKISTILNYSEVINILNSGKKAMEM